MTRRIPFLPRAVSPFGLWLLVLVVACGLDARSGPQVPAQTVWTSEAEFKIGPAYEGPAAVLALAMDQPQHTQKRRLALVID